MTSQSTPSTSSQPYIRYTRPPAQNDQAGWLIKEGRTLKKANARYFRLSGSTLSNHRHEEGAASWSVPLSHGQVTSGARRNEIVLKLMHRRLNVLAASRTEYRRWLYALRSAAEPCGDLQAFYSVGDVIGDGINGDVLSGRDRATGDSVAIKSLPLIADGSVADNAVTEEEIRIACALDHANLVKTLDVFHDGKAGKVHMVMEYVAGGELRARVDHPTGSLIKEGDGIRIARNLLSAIQYLHERGIVHRDIKLENVLCVHDDTARALRVKLADFGSSTTVSDKRRTLNSAVGTGYYLPPEIILEQEYGPPVDMWALGVLFYITLSSQLPFVGLDVDDYFKNVLADDVQFPQEDWKGISLDAQDFIRRLMERDASKRMTAKEALHHKWVVDSKIDSFEEEDDGDSPVEDERLTLMEGPQSILFGRKMTAADILARQRDKHGASGGGSRT